MKAERRHELQTNALAAWLAKTIEQLKPHANTILIGGGLLIAAIAAVVYLSGRTTSSSADSWGDYYQAASLDASNADNVDARIAELTNVAEKYPDEAPGLWARLMAAEAQLLRGANTRFKDREEALDDLDKAQLDFEEVIKGADGLPDSQNRLLLQRAHWGLAATFDALAEGDSAVEQYETLAGTWPDSALGKAAAERAENLKGMEDWFQWYASVDPATVEPTATRDRFPPGSTPGGFPGGTVPGGGHSFFPQPPENELPDDPDFNLPGALDPLGEPGASDLDFGSDPSDESGDDAADDDAASDSQPDSDPDADSDEP